MPDTPFDESPPQLPSDHRIAGSHPTSHGPVPNGPVPNEPVPNAPDLESSTQPAVGELELEFGVPFAGRILPQEQWAKTALKRLPVDQPLNFDELFGRTAPRILDIGCGNGRFVLASAVRRPECDHIGIDPLPLVIRYATRRANQRGLGNCRFAACDGLRFISQYCLPQSLSEIHIYHPQPYVRHDERHKRLFTPTFLSEVHRVLMPGGKLFVQSDNAAYWEYLEKTLGTVMSWHRQEGPWEEDAEGRTRREIIALHKGLKIFRGWATKRDDLDQPAMAALCATLPGPTFKASGNKNPNAWRRPRQRRGR